MSAFGDFEDLSAFLGSKSGLRMSHIYKPVMMLGVIRRGGSTTRTEIAEDFAFRGTEQIAYYKNKVVRRLSVRCRLNTR